MQNLTFRRLIVICPGVPDNTPLLPRPHTPDSMGEMNNLRHNEIFNCDVYKAFSARALVTKDRWKQTKTARDEFGGSPVCKQSLGLLGISLKNSDCPTTRDFDLTLEETGKIVDNINLIPVFQRTSSFFYYFAERDEAVRSSVDAPRVFSMNICFKQSFHLLDVKSFNKHYP